MSGRNERTRDPHMYFFVPSENVDIVCLASYLKAYVDATATIKPSKHPRDSERLGFTIGAGRTLTKDGLEDVITDSEEWAKEQKTYEFRRQPYEYSDSDTWEARKSAGPTLPREEEVSVVGGRRRARGDERREDDRRGDERRYDSNNPRTQSDVTASTRSTYQSSTFSRDGRDDRDQRSGLSSITDDTIDPSDSASNVPYDRHAGGRPKNPNPKPVGPNPDPDSFRGLSLSDPRPNQGAPRTQPNTTDRHKSSRDDDDKKPGNQRKVYDPWH